MTFHIKATTAEDMRKAAVEWLESEAYEHGQRGARAYRKRDAADYAARAAALEYAARFFDNLKIDAS